MKDLWKDIVQSLVVSLTPVTVGESLISVTTPGRLRLWNKSKTASYTHSHLRPIHSPQIIFTSSWIKSTLDEGQMEVPSIHGGHTGHSAPSFDHRHRQLARRFWERRCRGQLHIPPAPSCLGFLAHCMPLSADFDFRSARSSGQPTADTPKTSLWWAPPSEGSDPGLPGGAASGAPEGAAWAAGIEVVPPLGAGVVGAVGAVPDWACALPPVVAVPFISFDNSTWLPAISLSNLVCSVMVSLWDLNSSNISLLTSTTWYAALLVHSHW